MAHACLGGLVGGGAAIFGGGEESFRGAGLHSVAGTMNDSTLTGFLSQKKIGTSPVFTRLVDEDLSEVEGLPGGGLAPRSAVLCLSVGVHCRNLLRKKTPEKLPSFPRLK